MIYTIYKSGPKNDPSDYRGITLTCCLGKLFSTLLRVRIENGVEKKKLLSQFQAGLRKNYRKTYHIMTLFILIKKTIREGKYLYTCFVIFREAYDSMSKFQEFGLTGNKIEIIKTKYATPKVSLLYEGKISQSFSTKIGLKQVDVLSALLFNLYKNDLPNILNKESNSKEDQLQIPKLDNVTINNLLFADDLTILSRSKYDLQKKISNLEN